MYIYFISFTVNTSAKVLIWAAMVRYWQFTLIGVYISAHILLSYTHSVLLKLLPRILVIRLRLEMNISLNICRSLNMIKFNRAFDFLMKSITHDVVLSLRFTIFTCFYFWARCFTGPSTAPQWARMSSKLDKNKKMMQILVHYTTLAFHCYKGIIMSKLIKKSYIIDKKWKITSCLHWEITQNSVVVLLKSIQLMVRKTIVSYIFLF